MFDEKVFNAIKKEETRQREGLELIPSENYVSRQVLDALGSVLTNKYSEGYPGRRYYGGQENTDVIESLAIERAKKLASRIETGMLWINWYTASSPELPFGGVKRSGYGHELADIGFSEFVQKRLVVVKSAE